MLRSKVRLVGVALIPATILAFGYFSLGEAKADECRAKPDGSAPAGLHWYYRVDRANNRHCWYLHEQGMRVHSPISPTSRSSDDQDEAASEEVHKAPPVAVTQQPNYQQSTNLVERPTVNFVGRWVDLPRSVDLNAHEAVAGSNGFAPKQTVENRHEQLPSTWANVSAVDGEARDSTAAKTNFGSISLAGAVVLALLLMSEALIRFARTSGRGLLRVHLPDSDRAESPPEAPQQDTDEGRWPTTVDAIARAQTGVSELRRLLHRAGAGLKPPQSFAPSGSAQLHEHANREHDNRARAHSSFARPKSRSFSGMTWAPL